MLNKLVPFTASVILATVLVNAPAMAKDPAPRLLNLVGTGVITAPPDQVVIQIGVQRDAKTARAAMSANNKAMTEVMKTLKTAGIAEKDIQTSNFSVKPFYDRRKSNDYQYIPKIVGYSVYNMVTLKVRALDELGSVLDQVVTSGANRINNVRFAIDKPEKLQDEARKLAVADARKKAKLYAETADFTLGPIQSMRENHIMRPRMMARGEILGEASSAVPIAQGEMQVTSTVNISWEIK